MLTICDLSLALGGRQILDRVNFTLRPHRITVLVGRNGSGKSCLMSCVNQQFDYTGNIMEGEWDLSKIAPKERAKMVAILPQSIPAPHITAFRMAAFGRNPYLDFTGRLTDTDRLAVEQALKDAGAESLTSRYVDTLSGGERQRVALAMILAQDTPIALLDEPTAHMDQGYEASFLQTLVALKNTRMKTFLVVLHDITAAVRYADDLLVLDGGKLIFAGSKEEILRQRVLEETFGLYRYTMDGSQGQRIFFSAEADI